MKAKSLGTVYLICFASTPYKHAGHYVGWTSNLKARLEHHRNGTGARLMAAVSAAGIEWEVVATWEGDRALERKYHTRHGSRLCPRCKAAASSQHHSEAEESATYV